MDTHTEAYNRALGAFLGMAVGDALGCTLEFMGRDRITALPEYPHREIVGGGPFNWDLGDVTDDTSMAIALARGLVSHGKYNPEASVAHYLDWFRSDPVDVGSTIRSVLRGSHDLLSAQTNARAYHKFSGGKSAGNGSLMRIAPLAIRYWNDLDSLATATEIEARLLHFDQLSADACLPYTEMLAKLIQTGMMDWGFDSIINTNPLVQEAIHSSSEEAMVRANGPIGFVLTALSVAMNAVDNEETIFPDVEDDLQGQFAQSLLWTVNLGGDCDTNGAIAGALLGARYGIDAIPARWLDVLKCRDELVQLTDDLFNGRQRDIPFMVPVPVTEDRSGQLAWA